MNDEHSLAWPEITLGTALVPGAHLVTLRCGYCHHGIATRCTTGRWKKSPSSIFPLDSRSG